MWQPHSSMLASSLTPVTSSTSQASLGSVKIGRESFSPGDVLVESLLPRVRLQDHNPSSSSSSKPHISPPSFDKDHRGEAFPIRDHPAIRRAQEECATLLNGNAVSIIEDSDVKEEVVEITGRDAELVFSCRNIFQFLVMFVKDMERYVEIQVDVLDDKQTYRQLIITNARSLAKVEVTRCQLPLVLGPQPGWRYLCVDLHDLTRRSFGTKHVTTVQVRVSGHCRLLRVFFQDEQYSDGVLPHFLTFLGS